MSAGAHLLHIILTILFFPWGLVYICCAISAGNRRKRKSDRSREEELALLREIASQTRRNK